MHGAAPLVADESTLAQVAEELGSAGVYALDTEFHRERTYYPRLALLQLAWDDRVAIVDPLAVDLAPLREVFDGPGVAVIHAASQDLEVLDVACGAAPRVVFDTQVAAGFLGHATPSLGHLLERELDVHLPKSDRLTDWLQRPLGDQQLRYAADDVAHLLRLHAHLEAALRERGRLDWAVSECSRQRERARRLREPVDAWLRLKDARNLSATGRAVAQAVAGWRERRAAQLDRPVRRVLSDLTVISIAQRPPRDVDSLARVRGLDAHLARGRVGRELLEAIEVGLAATPPERPATRNRLDGALRPAATLVSAWVAQLAKTLDLDPALVATRSDIEDFLAGADHSRLREGWRAELLGAPIEALVAGEAALAFERSGALRLEVRSHQAFETLSSR